MKDLLLPLTVSIALGITVYSGSLSAANSQQSRMMTCNADAKTKALTGDVRKDFMKTCLSGDVAPAAASTTQQEKMKSCNADAGKQALKGDARKQFMSSCLRGT